MSLDRIVTYISTNKLLYLVSCRNTAARRGISQKPNECHNLTNHYRPASDHLYDYYHAFTRSWQPGSIQCGQSGCIWDTRCANDFTHLQNFRYCVLDQARIEQTRVEQNRIEQNRIEQNLLYQARLEQSRVDQSRIDQTRLHQTKNRIVLNCTNILQPVNICSSETFSCDLVAVHSSLCTTVAFAGLGNAAISSQPSSTVIQCSLQQLITVSIMNWKTPYFFVTLK